MSYGGCLSHKKWKKIFVLIAKIKSRTILWLMTEKFTKIMNICWLVNCRKKSTYQFLWRFLLFSHTTVLQFFVLFSFFYFINRHRKNDSIRLLKKKTLELTSYSNHFEKLTARVMLPRAKLILTQLNPTKLFLAILI